MGNRPQEFFGLTGTTRASYRGVFIQTPMPARRLFLRRLALAGFTMLLLAVGPGRARAAFVLTLAQSGPNVVATGSGSIDLLAFNAFPALGGTAPAQVFSSNGILYAGPATATGVTVYTGGGLTGPASFGSGGALTAGAGSGNLVGINYSLMSSPEIVVPAGYITGTTLSDSSTFTGQTFSTLGLNPGTYTYSWGSGLAADSLTIHVGVPEPATWLSGALLVGAAALTIWRQRLRARS